MRLRTFWMRRAMKFGEKIAGMQDAAVYV